MKLTFVCGTKILDLNQLKAVENDELITVFVENNNTIYNYALKDIQASIEGKPLDILQALRTALFQEVQKVIPQFQNRVLGLRRVPRTVINDILHLGYSIANESPSSQLDSFCFPQTPTDDEGEGGAAGAQSMIQLLTTIVDLKKLVEKLDKTVSSLTVCNADLVSRIDRLDQQVSRLTTPGENQQNQQVDNRTDDEDDDESVLNSSQGEPSSVDEAVAPPATEQPEPPAAATGEALGQPTATPGEEERNEEGNGDFQLQRHQRKRDRNKKENPSVPLRPAKTQMKDVYIGLVDPSCSPQDVGNHLTAKGVKTLSSQVKQLCRNGQYSSFRVSVPVDKYEDVLNSKKELLPTGLKVRPFGPNKPKNNPKKNSNFKPAPSGKAKVDGRNFGNRQQPPTPPQSRSPSPPPPQETRIPPPLAQSIPTMIQSTPLLPMAYPLPLTPQLTYRMDTGLPQSRPHTPYGELPQTLSTSSQLMNNTDFFHVGGNRLPSLIDTYNSTWPRLR